MRGDGIFSLRNVIPREGRLIAGCQAGQKTNNEQDWEDVSPYV
jgi:hypothetical protein